MEPPAEEVAEAPPPPPTGGALVVTPAEWAQIEDVPPQTRRVGQLFQRVTKELRDGRFGEAPTPLPFDEALYAQVSGAPATAAATAAAKKTSKKDALLRKRAEELAVTDRARALAAAGAATPPRQESYGGRLESYAYALLLWLRGRPQPAAAVAAAQARGCLERRGVTLPASLSGELRRLEAGDGRPLAALEEICAAEELLSTRAVDAELTLHPEQAAFVRAVRLACDPGAAPLLLRYCTPPSGGKTSASALLGAVLAELPAAAKPRRHVLYVCYSRPVRVDVCKHLVAASVAFAVVVGGIASPNYGCFFGRHRKKQGKPQEPPLRPEERAAWSLAFCLECDRFPVVLVCDLPSARLLLQHRDVDVLLFDEPTADVTASMREEVRDVLRCCPRVTVLMSASVPGFDRLQRLAELFRTRHGAEAELLSVEAARLPMSVTARDGKGRVWAPHHFGVGVEALRRHGHLRRFYSPPVLRQLRPRAEELSFADLLSYEAIRDACLRLLEERGAAPQQPRDEEEPEAAEKEEEALDLALFCGPQAARLPGASLLILRAPADFEPSLQVNLAGTPSLKQLLKAAELPRTRSTQSSGSERRRRDDEDGGGDRSQRREELLQQRNEAKGGWEEERRVCWPAKCVVNSKAHVVRFHQAPAACVLPEKWLRAELPLADAVRDTSRVELVEAALSGVLLFGNGSDALFETAAQTLAEQGKESFLVADKSLAYGLNVALDRVVVSGAPPLSRTELMQLCGRAGRSGRASKAEVVFLTPEALRAALTPPPPAEGDDETTTAASRSAFDDV
jgi:hypothetical protein